MQAKPSLRQVTNASRVVDPSTGLTKLDVVRYYAQVAAWALPHLQQRPAYIKRAPLGIARAMVFQQHPKGPRGLRGTDPALWPGHAPALAFDSADDLVAAAQLGMIELHTWNSTSAAITQPDRARGTRWPRTSAAARRSGPVTPRRLNPPAAPTPARGRSAFRGHAARCRLRTRAGAAAGPA